MADQNSTQNSVVEPSKVPNRAPAALHDALDELFAFMVANHSPDGTVTLKAPGDPPMFGDLTLVLYYLHGSDAEASA